MIPTQKRTALQSVTMFLALTLCATGFVVPSSLVDLSIAHTAIEPQPEIELSILAEDEMLRQYGTYAAHVSEEVKVVDIAARKLSFEIAAESTQDRTQPIYEVYKNGFYVDVPAEWQWYIRDLADEHDFDEKLIFGLILAESSFNPDAKGDSGRSLGLGQINSYWIRANTILRFTDDYKSRDLFDPYDNIITIVELWNYAREAYSLDVRRELDMKRLLYWYNSGEDPTQVTNWPYSNDIFRYADELILIEG